MTNQVLCDEFAERLADLLERDVGETTRAALESHALGCSDCGSLLADMRKLRIDASNLPVLTPGRDLWDGILQRIDAPVIPLRTDRLGRSKDATRWRRWVPMVAAAVLLIALTSTSTYYLTVRGHADSTVTRTVQTMAPPRDSQAESLGLPSAIVASRGDGSSDTTREAKAPSGATIIRSSSAQFASVKRSAEQVYAGEIARLRVVLERRRAQLDPVTISVVERNLKVIDDAIAQCKLALAKDPASRFLMESLNNALENKVELLRTATMLPSRS